LISFSGFDPNHAYGANFYHVSDGSSHQDLVSGSFNLSLHFSAVPEPGTLATSSIAMVLLGVFRLARHRS
jgi:hypothetical protein